MISLRCCLPLCVCVVEWLFLGRQLPSLKSQGVLAGVLLTAGVYIMTDPSISFEGSFMGIVWLNVWFWLLVFQMTYGKHICDSVPMSQWERVLYTNALGVPWTLLLFFFFGEHRTLAKAEASAPMLTWVTLSLIFGVGISYTGWSLRVIVSATTYSLVGVLNKMATIAFNMIAFPSDTSVVGVMALVACVLIGCFYEDPPKTTRRPMYLKVLEQLTKGKKLGGAMDNA